MPITFRPNHLMQRLPRFWCARSQCMQQQLFIWPSRQIRHGCRVISNTRSTFMTMPRMLRTTKWMRKPQFTLHCHACLLRSQVTRKTTISPLLKFYRPPSSQFTNQIQHLVHAFGHQSETYTFHDRTASFFVLTTSRPCFLVTITIRLFISKKKD